MKANRSAKGRKKRNITFSILILIILSCIAASLAVIGPSLFTNNSKLLLNDINAQYEVGEIAEEDVKSNQSFYYIDEKETLKRQEEAYARPLPLFNISLLDTRSSYDALEDYLTNNLEENDYTNLIEEYSYEIMQTLLSKGVFNSQELENMKDDGYNSIKYGITSRFADEKEFTIFPIESLLTLDNIEDAIEIALQTLDSDLPEEVQRTIISIISTTIQSNVHYDEYMTTVERENERDRVEPVIVKVDKGSFIIKKDSVIEEESLRTISAMRAATVKYNVTQIIGRLIFAVIITGGSLYAVFTLFKYSKRKYQIAIIFLLGLIIIQILTYLSLSLFSGRGFEWLDPFLPVFSLPLLLSLMTNKKRIGMVSAVTLSSYLALYPFTTIITFFFLLVISFIAIYYIKYVAKRINMIYQWFFTVLGASGVVLLATLIHGYSLNTLLPSIAIISINLTITYAITAFLLPILEVTLNLPTQFRLKELATTYQKQLVRLSQVAVGTYNHSLAVADLAYNGALAIGADPLLAQVGALYHDIGKQENPEYFIENQLGENKHDDLKASLSVAIIKSHVKVGIEKGREAKLPQEVLDIIAQHHGNDIIAVFLKEAQQEAALNNKNSKVGEQDYSYHNEVPQTPESAIVMLADSVEAASRSIVKPSPQKYEKLINSIIMRKIERKQLVFSRLSLNDLELITKSFVQIITGRNHVRMKYPDDKEE